MPSFEEIKSDYMIEGEAEDGETIIRLRPLIEQEIRDTVWDFKYTELYWNLKDQRQPDGAWVYQIHFYREKNESTGSDS